MFRFGGFSSGFLIKYMAQLSCPLNDTIKRATDCNQHFIILLANLMIFAELKNIRQDNNKDWFTLKVVASVLRNIVPHDLARKIMLSLSVRNCTILTQACVGDRIFLWMWLMLMFYFCVSTVSTVERVINKTKPSSMQIFVYLISFVRGMRDVYQRHIWRLARNCNHSIKIWRKRKFKIRTLLFRNLFQWS